MALRIRFQYPTASKLGYSIERLSDGLRYDFSILTFVATPAMLISPLPEGETSFVGSYSTTLTATPAGIFTDGDYVVTVHDLANSEAVVAELGATMHSGDDATQLLGAPSNPTVSDDGFESFSVGAGNFQYNPTGSPWTFTPASGISGNNSAFTQGNPAAPEGVQVGIIQFTGSISQIVDNWAAGTYAILFQAAQRANLNSAKQDLGILVDGKVVGTCTPAGIDFSIYYATPQFTVVAGNHSIAFVGQNTASGDNTAFIDNIKIVRF